MKAPKHVIVGLILGLFAATASAASAPPSLENVVPIVQRQVPGTMLDARGPLRSSEGELRYQIKWLTEDGRVIWFTVDVRTGRVSG